MSEGKGADAQTDEATSHLGFAAGPDEFRVGAVEVRMSYAQIVETLRSCVCVGAPEELKERILRHIRSQRASGSDADCSGA